MANNLKKSGPLFFKFAGLQCACASHDLANDSDSDRGGGAFGNVGGGGGGVIVHQAKPSHTPTRIPQNVRCVVLWHKQTSLQSQKCPRCVRNRFVTMHK